MFGQNDFEGTIIDYKFPSKMSKSSEILGNFIYASINEELTIVMGRDFARL